MASGGSWPGPGAAVKRSPAGARLVRVVASLVCTTLLLDAGLAAAQLRRTPAFQLEHFEPLAEPTGNVLNVAGSDQRPHLAPTVGLICHHAAGTVVLASDAGQQLEALAGQTRCELVASLGLLDLGGVGLALPLVLHQDAPDPAVFGLAPADFEGVVAGDLRITPRVRLLRRVAGFGAAVLTPVYLPTGDGGSLNGADGVRLEPRLALDWRHPSGWLVAVNLGYQLLNPLLLHNVVLDDQLRWGLGLRAPLGWAGLRAFGVAWGSATRADNLDPADPGRTVDDDRNDPAEALVGLEVPLPQGLLLRAAGGRALGRGIGAARWRALAAVDWVGPEPAPFVPLALDRPLRGPLADLSLLLHLPLPVGVQPFARRRHAAVGGDALLSVTTARVGRPADLAVALELAPTHREARAGLGDSLALDGHVALAVTESVELSAAVPAAFGGEAGGGVLGDLRLKAKVLALDAAERPYGAGLVVPLSLPTATEPGWSSSAARVGSVATGEVLLGNYWLRGNLGLHVADDDGPERPLQAVLEVGAALAWEPGSGWQAALELFAERDLDDLVQRQREALFGGALLLGRQPERGASWRAGLQVIRTVGDETQVELLLRGGWRCGRIDRDRDGIDDERDRCPHQPEDPDGDRDDDGCPEDDPDRDGDGFADPVDRCPGQAEDLDGFEDSDGCPDLDNDGDAVPDQADDCPRRPGPKGNAGCPDPDDDGVYGPADRCPDDAEDRDGFEDGDGCPELDNDGDGVPDDADRCRDEPGVVQWQGCNDVEILLLFDLASAQLLPEGQATLDSVAEILRSHGSLERVVVEGHTDDSGSVELNQTLSLERARAVAAELVARDVPRALLEPQGFGATRPAVDCSGLEGPAREAAMARNRRVRLRIQLRPSGP